MLIIKQLINCEKCPHYCSTGCYVVGVCPIKRCNEQQIIRDERDKRKKEHEEIQLNFEIFKEKEATK